MSFPVIQGVYTVPSFFQLSTVDERCMWACARALSLQYNRAGIRSVETFVRTVQDSLLTWQSAIADGVTPAYMIFTFRNVNVCLLSGIPNARTALSFVSDYGEFAPPGPFNATALRGGDAILSAIQEAYRQNPAPTLFAGWSYGGVIAQYLAPAFKTIVNNDDIRVITFGSPRPAKRQFGPVYNGIETLRVSCEGDPLPYLVPWSTEDAVAYWAFRAYRAFAEPNDWRHFGRGVMLNQTGLIWSRDMPSFPDGGIGTSVVGWATGLMSNPVGEHTIAAYEARLSALIQNEPIDDGGHRVVIPAPPGPPPGNELPGPPALPVRDRVPIPERIPDEPPPKPPGVRPGPTFYAAAIFTGELRRKEWWVYHWETPIFRARTKQSAKRTASRLNSVQLAWMQSTAGEQADLLDAISMEFPDS